jgi:ribosomal protein S6
MIGGFMRNYDLTVLINTEGGEESAKANHAKLNDIITSNKGAIYSSAFNGRIDLVNTFRKYTQAYAIRIQYSATVECLDALHKEFKINEAIIRQVNSSMEKILNPTQIEELVS